MRRDNASPWRGMLALIWCLLAGTADLHAQSAPVPRWVCEAQTVFDAGFENAWLAAGSAGVGGSHGASSRLAPRPAHTSVLYYAYAAASRTAAAPLIVVLHGAAGPGNAASAAVATRDAWIGLADSVGAIIVAPVASGAQGGWVPSNDFPALDAILDDVQSAYDIDLTRRYLWGFSAGGHVAHGLTLQYSPQRFAAYAVHAGVLDAYAGSNAPALSPRRVPLSSWIGNADSLLSYAQLDATRFVNAGWIREVDFDDHAFSGGHTYSSSHFNAIWSFWCRHAALNTP